MQNETISGIEYSKPKVYLLQETGIGTAEYAARTCYDSFDKSENHNVREFNVLVDGGCGDISETYIDDIKHLLNNIEHSNLLNDLAWTYHHHSILEHANLTYLVKGTSRGVLQEHARHRIQGISVKSTRYTMSPVINAFIAHLPLIKEQDKQTTATAFATFCNNNIDYLVTNSAYNNIEHMAVWHKLMYQYSLIGKEEFMKTFTTKFMRENVLNVGGTPENIFERLQSQKQKRNVGDAAKHIVTDNWKVDMVVTFNLRSLKNYFTLRDSGAAYFQIRWLAKAMKESTPQKYLDLIVKSK